MMTMASDLDSDSSESVSFERSTILTLDLESRKLWRKKERREDRKRERDREGYIVRTVYTKSVFFRIRT